MKRRIGILCLLFCMILVSCRKKNTEFRMTEELDGQEREEVNAMMGTFASDGNTIYMIGGDIVYRVDKEKKELVVNCGDFLCNHDSITCSARLPYMDNFYEIKRNGDHVYILSNIIYEIDENSKKEVGHGGYGNYENKILFGDYIAYFEKEDVIVVKNIETDKEVQRFEGIRGYVQGNFYYEGQLYYITDTSQLIRLDLNTGEKEIIEKKGVTRASIYNGFIYYIKISEETDSNCLVKMNPKTLEKQELIEGVFYYNMLGETLYYVSYPERELYCSYLNGENRKKLSDKNGQEWGWIWAFPWTETLILNEDLYTFYIFDTNSGKINYEEPLIRPGKGGEVIPDELLQE